MAGLGKSQTRHDATVWIIAVQRTEQPRVFFAPGQSEAQAVSRWFNEASGVLDQVLRNHEDSGGEGAQVSVEAANGFKHQTSAASMAGEGAEWAAARAWSLPGEHDGIKVPRQLLVVEAGQSAATGPGQ